MWSACSLRRVSKTFARILLAAQSREIPQMFFCLPTCLIDFQEFIMSNQTSIVIDFSHPQGPQRLQKMVCWGHTEIFTPASENRILVCKWMGSVCVLKRGNWGLLRSIDVTQFKKIFWSAIHWIGAHQLSCPTRHPSFPAVLVGL